MSRDPVEDPDPTPMPEMDKSPLEEMEAQENAEQGISSRKKKPRRICVRRRIPE